MSSRIIAEIDYEKDGKQVGWLGLPHSVTRSAYGKIMIPVAVIKNGKGPTVYFQAGNHGDEYEGQIALVKLIREIDPARIQGRLIVVPAANFPAAMAGTRVSPIDEGNLNRAFPGDPDGTVTEQIAYYIDSVLFPMADLFHDLHSGGSSLQYVPFASMHEIPGSPLNEKCLAALEAFAFDIALMWRPAKPDARFAPVAAMKRGVPALGGEFGGGGRVDPKTLAKVELGLRRTLVHMGLMEKPKDWTNAPKPRRMAVPGQDWYVYAPQPGLFEPAVELGATVRAGDFCGHVHFVDDPARPAVPCFFKKDGFVICQRHYGRVERGDCVAHLAIDA